MDELSGHDVEIIAEGGVALCYILGARVASETCNMTTMAAGDPALFELIGAAGRRVAEETFRYGLHGPRLPALVE